MVKFNEIKLSYTCPAFPPDGITMDKAYSIVKKGDKFYFTDGINEFEGDEQFIKMFFTPNGVEWKDVDFKEDVKQEVKFTKPFDNKQ